MYFGSCQLSVVNCILLHLTSILLHCVWFMNVYVDLMCLTMAHFIYYNRVINFMTCVQKILGCFCINACTGDSQM